MQRAQPESVHEAITERVSLRDRVRTLLDALSAARTLEFESLFAEDATRFDVVLTFLALLELMKMNAVRATQEDRFGRIVIELAVTDASALALESIDEYQSHPVVEEAPAVEEADDGRGQ